MLLTPFDFKQEMIKTRRNQILLGAAEVFAEKGFHKATTKEIAKAAGISEGTIYNYFENKDEILLAMIDLLAVQSLQSLVIDQHIEEPRQLFTAIFYNRYQLIQERGHLIAPIMAEVFADAHLRQEVYDKIIKPLAAHLEQYLRAKIEAKEFRELDPVIVTRAIVGAMFVNFVFKLTELDPRYKDISFDSMIEEIITLILSGLSAPDAKQ
jgi:AcrR family transcriptional regulator